MGSHGKRMRGKTSLNPNRTTQNPESIRRANVRAVKRKMKFDKYEQSRGSRPKEFGSSHWIGSHFESRNK